MRECVLCPAHTYEVDGVCESCLLSSPALCTVDFFVAQGMCEPGSTSDNSSCTRCEHQTENRIANVDHTECVDECPVGEYGVPFYYQCQPCAPCGSDQFANSTCGGFGQLPDCISCTVCTGGDSVLQRCTNVTDTICGECVGPTSCPPGSILLECADSSIFGERECMPCPEGQYESGGACVDCAGVESDCVELGWAFIPCRVSETSDVTECVDCGSIGMLATVDRHACSQICAPAGYILPGSSQCQPCIACPRGSYQSVPCTLHQARECSECSECPDGMVVAQACSQFADTVCAVEGAACAGPTSCPDGMLWLDCGEGSVEGIRECVVCPVGSTADTCVGVCAGPLECVPGEVLLDCGASSVAGLRECVACSEGQFDDGGACVDCAHSAESCVGAGYAFIGCVPGDTSDVSSCTDCTSMSKLVSPDGTTCLDACDVGSTVDSTGTFCEECTPCPAGQYVGTSCTASSPHTCLPCTACGDGMVVREACSMFADTDCVVGVDVCPFGQYVHAVTFMCAECSACPEGEYIMTSCTATSAATCRPCSECGEGMVPSEACSALADTVCVVGVDECPFGQYVDPDTFQCADCAVCASGSYMTETCTATAAGVCTPCSECDPGYVASEECSNLADVVCVAGVDECPVGQYVDPATYFCAECNACPDNHFMATSCTATHSGVCQECSVCNDEQVRTSRCSAVADTVCAALGTGCPFGEFLHSGTGQCEACTACAGDAFAASTCTALVAGACLDCSVCGEGFVEARACSSADDTVCVAAPDGCAIDAYLDASSGECEACLPCPDGHFMTASCTSTLLGVCQECTVCDSGLAELEACSAVADTVCEVGCAFGTFMHAGTGQCEACSPCPDGRYLSSTCTPPFGWCVP